MNSEFNLLSLLFLIALGWIFLVTILSVVTSTDVSIYDAISDGNYQQIKDILDRGANPNFIKNDGMPPLFIAINYNNIVAVKLLVDYGANINIDINGKLPLTTEYYNFNPLLHSIIKERQEITQLLLDKEAERGIHYFCGIGDREIVADYLKNTPELISSKRNNCGLLHFAIISEKLELIDLLIKNSININDFSKTVGTPLHQAVRREKIELTRHLIELGADLEALYNGKTPLSIAVSTNNKKIVELLISLGANININNFVFEYPLLVAVEHGYLEIASILLENGAEIKQRQNLDGKTLLHIAVEKNNILMTDLLIHHGANVNACSYFGSSPLGISHSNIKYKEIEKLLLQYGATNYGIDD